MKLVIFKEKKLIRFKVKKPVKLLNRPLTIDDGSVMTEQTVLEALMLHGGFDSLMLDEVLYPIKHRVLNDAPMLDQGFETKHHEHGVHTIPVYLDQGFDPTKYRRFIEDLRNLRKLIGGTILHKYVPEPPCCWLDIPLIYGEYSIILRVDPRNLCVRGYSTNKDTEEFWEFSDSSLIHASKPLPYSGSLLRDDGLCSVASQSQGFYVQPGTIPVDFLRSVWLGYGHLRRAIVNLVNQEPYLNPPHSARYLLCIILMITEAARIELIAECVVQNLWSSRTINLTMQSIMTALSMGTFSGPNKSYVSKIFVKRSIETYVTERPSRYSFTNTLVSIYYVVVKEIYSPEKSRKIYGTVKLADIDREVMDTVYERTSDEFEIKREGEMLSLYSSSKLVIANDPFIIEVYLRDDDGEIANGRIVFDQVYYKSPFDKHLEQYVLGEHCKVGVGYSVIEYAVGAVIDVVLINNHDVESSAYVHGSITACYNLKNSESPTRLMLFEKSENDCVQVSSQQPIPLTGRLFPVPLNAILTISVCLRDRDSLSLIPCGFLIFLPAAGTQLKNIIGENRQVQVSITCLPL